MSRVKHFRELDVSQNAMNLAMNAVDLTEPRTTEDRFNLTDQIRRSSCSVCTNLAEAWRNRRYKHPLIAKLSDSETEAAETQVSAELAMRWDENTFQQIDSGYEKVLGQIIKMANPPEKWLIHGSEPEGRRTGVPENKPARVPKPPLPRYSNTPSHAL